MDIYFAGDDRPAFVPNESYRVYCMHNGELVSRREPITDSTLWNQTCGRWEREEVVPILPSTRELLALEAWHSSPCVTPLVNCQFNIKDEYERLAAHNYLFDDIYGQAAMGDDNVIVNPDIYNKIESFSLGSFFVYRLIKYLAFHPIDKIIFINSLDEKGPLNKDAYYAAIKVRDKVAKRLGVQKHLVFVLDGFYETYPVTEELQNIEAITSSGSCHSLAMPGLISIGPGRNVPDFSVARDIYGHIAEMCDNMRRVTFPADDEMLPEVCNGIGEKITDQIRVDLKHKDIALKEYADAIARTEAERVSLQESLDELENGKIVKEMLEDIKLLRNFKDIDSIEVYTDFKIKVVTKELDLSTEIRPDLFEGKSIKIGGFRFVIDATKMRREFFSYIKIFNINGPYSGWHHPHIEASGRPCFSEWEHSLIEAIDNYSLFNIVSIILNYLKTFNPEDSYGRNVLYFDDDGVFGFTDDYNPVEDDDQDGTYIDGEWVAFVPYENGEYVDFEWEFYEDGVNGEFSSGEWQWYQPNLNGEFVDGQWEFYNENGVLESTIEEEEVNV